MKIKSVYVEELNQRLTGTVDFFDSINVITGSNGSGKTTIIKACWYLLSGNFKSVLLELNFKKIILTTDLLQITATCSDPKSEDPLYSLSLKPIGKLPFETTQLLKAIEKPLEGTWNEIKDGLWRYGILTSINHESLFFPTFRRVEGGFLLGNRLDRAKRANQSSLTVDSEGEDELTKALKATSAALSEFRNNFICSMSTSDVEKLVFDTKSKMDSKQTENYESLAKSISNDIKTWQKEGESNSESAQYLKEIQAQVTEIERIKSEIIEPMRLLDAEISQYFPGRSIKINDVKLGTGEEEISASALSAGEKQLLSFLSYAAFFEKNIFIVDEPELSLHLDWQRKLISSLAALGSTHQYFFVTHSPAIYTKFADYEVSLDQLNIG